jgi:hypothetical protein
VAILAFEIVTAGRLNRMQPVTYYAEQSSSLNMTTTVTDIPGCSITLSTTTDNAVYLAYGIFDFDLGGATTATALGRLNVDGADTGKTARYGAEVASDVSTVAQQWRGTLASAGSHTLKLRGSTSAGTNLFAFSQSTLTVVIYEVV